MGAQARDQWGFEGPYRAILVLNMIEELELDVDATESPRPVWEENDASATLPLRALQWVSVAQKRSGNLEAKNDICIAGRGSRVRVVNSDVSGALQ